MTQRDAVQEVSSAFGVPLRKVLRPDFFIMLRELLANLEFIAFEERLEAAGYSTDDSLCEVNADGQIISLFTDAEHVPVETIDSLAEVSLLGLLDVSLGVAEARALASLRRVEHLIVSVDRDNTQELLPAIAEMQTLKSLFIAGTSTTPIDLEPLTSLPELKSLFIENSPVRSLEPLSRFRALRHLAYDAENSGVEHLVKAQQIQKLVWLDTATDMDVAFLREMTQLELLDAEDLEIPPETLRDLVHLRALSMTYSQPSLEPLLPLRGLEVLRLDNSRLERFSEFGLFPQLRNLSVKDGGVTDLSSFTGHPSLEYLNLSKNPIAVPPSQLSLPKLQHLEWAAHPEHRLEHADFLVDCLSLETLNLDGHTLASAEFLRRLPNLRSLNLAGNQIEDVEPLGDLPNLSVLNLEGNKITRIAPLAAASALTTLEVRGNRIGDLPSLAALTRLEDLRMSNTNASDLSFVKRLKQLFRLGAAENGIAHVEALLELPHIADVDLSSNRITTVPRDVCAMSSLMSLKLTGNPISHLDPELFSGDGKATLRSLRDYFRALSRGSALHDQVKLLLVGNGRVGKTSVVSRLLDDTFDDLQPSTHGIQLRQWTLAHAAQDKLHGTPLRVNVWDFGGQDIYHATHRLFMKTRALFLLVWDRDTEGRQFSHDESGERYENYPLPYWVDYVKALSGSPVIVVQNKVDTLQDKQPRYGTELQAVYPPPQGILDFVHVSARRAEQNGMAGLTDTILLALNGIESIGRELPLQWIQVRERLQGMEQRFIEFDAFVALCASHGLMGTEPLSIAEFLHQAGAIFYQPRSFGNRIILDQQWAIEAVYALFDRRGAAYTDLKIAARHGLTLELLKQKVWRHFSEDEHQLLLEFMQSCELCFELAKGLYYVPQLLPEEKPSRIQVRWPRPTQQCLQITYPFLHRAIIERFLVRTGRLGADDEPDIWKNGIAIVDPNTSTEAMVEAFPEEKRVLVLAKGNAAVELLQMIRQELEDLHSDFPATMAVSADQGQSFVELQALKQYAAAGSQFVPSTTKTLVDLAPLKPFLAEPGRRLARGELRVAPTVAAAAAAPPEEIFLSYAWGDSRESGESREALVDRVYDTLVARNYHVVRDKKDNGYRQEIRSFMQRLGKGKLVVVVISDKYLQSPFCMFELLEIYRSGKFRERIYPIVLADAKLYTLLERLQYVLYWKKQKEELEKTIAEIGIGSLSSTGALAEYDLYYRQVCNSVDEITSLLADLNALTPRKLEDNNFEVLVGAIEDHLSTTSTDKPGP